MTPDELQDALDKANLEYGWDDAAEQQPDWYIDTEVEEW